MPVRIPVDPPLPVTVVGFAARPLGLLVAWEQRTNGWSPTGWSAIVRCEYEGKAREESLNPRWIDDDPALRPLVEPPEVSAAPSPSHDRLTCIYCRG